MLDKIKALCKEQQLTIVGLERAAHLSESTICKWDETMPAADKLARVAKVLHTTVEDLLTDDREEVSA